MAKLANQKALSNAEEVVIAFIPPQIEGKGIKDLTTQQRREGRFIHEQLAMLDRATFAELRQATQYPLSRIVSHANWAIKAGRAKLAIRRSK